MDQACVVLIGTRESLLIAESFPILVFDLQDVIILYRQDKFGTRRNDKMFFSSHHLIDHAKGTLVGSLIVVAGRKIPWTNLLIPQGL